MRVCLLEYNRHNDLIKLSGRNNDKAGEPFTKHLVTYIPRFDKSFGLPDVKYDCMVFDLGHSAGTVPEAFKLCDIKIAVGTGAIWRQSEFGLLKDLTSKAGGLSGWRLFVNMGTPKILRETDMYGITAGCFPYEPDPMFPGNETISFLEEIL